MKVCALVVCSIAVAVHAQQVERSVFSSGAVRSTSGGVAVQGTIGQPIVGMSVGSSLGAFHGFWYGQVSGVLSVERGAPFEARVTPQPAVESATLEVGCSGQVEASLVTLQGRRIAELTLVPTARGRLAALDCSTLASGLYLVQVRCQGQEMFLPMMIAK
ncbi:MAG: hypothetical protein KatS3mg038_0866 [Candidatus Kapaibacterium sp.]|nr:MAG: hypothetical protein KatS3mg038_0866 [Candidatus Kapabacteria bacterium]